MNEQITGALFKRMVLHGAAVITAQKQAINDLNVFPVPDGDTGTNMSMTIGTAVTELRKSEPATVEQAASVTASALLRGGPRQFRRHSLPAVPRPVQGPEGPGDCGRRRFRRRHAGGCLRRLQGGDEARRGHGTHRLPSCRQAGGGHSRRRRDGPGAGPGGRHPSGLCRPGPDHRDEPGAEKGPAWWTPAARAIS